MAAPGPRASLANQKSSGCISASMTSFESLFCCKAVHCLQNANSPHRGFTFTSGSYLMNEVYFFTPLPLAPASSQSFKINCQRLFSLKPVPSVQASLTPPPIPSNRPPQNIVSPLWSRLQPAANARTLGPFFASPLSFSFHLSLL